jgi:Fe-S-cluster containining protein
MAHTEQEISNSLRLFYKNVKDKIEATNKKVSKIKFILLGCDGKSYCTTYDTKTKETIVDELKLKL